MLTVRKDAPPFVRFEYLECGVDLDASAKSGTRVPLVKPHALIMQHGSKDVVEKDAEDWLAQIKRQALEGRYDPTWVARFELQYSEFTKGNELPRHGTPIRTWSGPNREQIVRLQAIGITTIEDLAAVPDSGLQNIGLDGRYLRDLAKTYLDEARNVGVTAKKVVDLEQANRELTEQMERMAGQIAELTAALPADKKRETLHAKR